jgi:hypothetical protein
MILVNARAFWSYRCLHSHYCLSDFELRSELANFQHRSNINITPFCDHITVPCHLSNPLFGFNYGASMGHWSCSICANRWLCCSECSVWSSRTKTPQVLKLLIPLLMQVVSHLTGSFCVITLEASPMGLFGKQYPVLVATLSHEAPFLLTLPANQKCSRLARRGGVRRISAMIYDDVRSVIKIRLREVGLIPGCHSRC